VPPSTRDFDRAAQELRRLNRRNGSLLRTYRACDLPQFIAGLQDNLDAMADAEFLSRCVPCLRWLPPCAWKETDSGCARTSDFEVLPMGAYVGQRTKTSGPSVTRDRRQGGYGHSSAALRVIRK